VIPLGSKSGAQRWGILVTALPQSDFGSSWFAQRRLAYAVETRLWCAVHDAADTNLDARSNDCIRDSRIGIYSWAYLEEKSVRKTVGRRR
jgi:hypothetical protein